MRLFVLIFAVTVMGCASNNQESLISSEQLAEIADDKDVIVISTQTHAEYDSIHIPGAIHVFYKDLNHNIPVTGMLKPVDELVSVFEKNGISRNHKLIVYDNGEAKYAGRIFWALTYLGFDNVSMLDGNFASWTTAGKPVTEQTTKHTKTELLPKIRPEIKIPMAEVKSKLDHPGTIIVDVRSSAEYNGTSERSQGHLPGAINLPHTKLLTSNHAVKPRDAISAILIEKGITTDKEIVVYCHTSTRAGLVFMILHSVMDYPDVRVYDGAYEEWSNAGNLVVQ